MPKAVATPLVWEVVTVKPGRSREAAIKFYVSEVEARMAVEQATADGFATRTQPIRLPSDARELADLLASFIDRIGA